MATAMVEVRDATGLVILDTSVRIMKTLGTFVTTNVPGSMSLPINEPGEFTYYTQLISPGSYDPTIIWVFPLILWNNNVVSWTFPRELEWNNSQTINTPLRVFYGVQ